MDKEIKTSDYVYNLPEDKIALHPLTERDQAKLLVYEKGRIGHHRFVDLANYLPAGSTLFFNNTKVIPARLFFKKATGAQIEIFLLNPSDAQIPLQLALQQTEKTQWQCAIGNQKRWKSGDVLELDSSGLTLRATLIDPVHGIVEFSWQPQDLCFSDIIEKLGNTPLPPYINRTAQEADKERYQTVYSRHEGAVAAPTAGLHFTRRVLDELQAKGIRQDFLTLHVSAGTFQPIKSENAAQHHMHSEQVVVTRKNLETLLASDKVLAVGTTSMRTLESLYWYGVKLLNGKAEQFSIGQHDPYTLPAKQLPGRKEAIARVLDTLSDNDSLVGHTSIYILPGYQFRVCDGLITNFHQPGSTLMLLIAAFVGDDWKRIYTEALDNNYRFLSYGDSSLLLPGV